MTDGRTDKKFERASCWSITAFNDEIDLIEAQDSWPKFVKKILGGREICPTTGKEHFQGALFSHGTIRFSQVKSWLPQAHIEAAKKEEALVKYVMKKETAVSEKKVIHNSYKFYRVDQIIQLIAKEAITIYMRSPGAHSLLGIKLWIRDYDDEEDPCRFDQITKSLVSNDMNILNFIDSKVKKLWKTYHYEVLKYLDKIVSITDFVDDTGGVSEPDLEVIEPVQIVQDSLDGSEYDWLNQK